jgi:CubicO group peptidase (beta-lactamase class C family)
LRQTQDFAACSPDVGRFGVILAVSGDRLVVAAPSYPQGGAAGDVHVFRRGSAGWTAEGRLRTGDAAPDSLALDGRTLVVGSTQQSSATGGTLQVFDLDEVALLPPAPCAAEPEVWPGKDWRVESPVEHGMNPLLLARAGEEALRPDGHTQGVVVVRHGVVVAEWYEEGRDATSYAASWSVAKSVAGALIGRAIALGDLPDEDVHLDEFYPQWAGTPKADITLRHLLQMTSGLDFGENHSTRPGNVSDIAYLASMAKDHLAYVLESQLQRPPGSFWSYSSGDSMLLSGVIEAATGLSAGEYARRYLFGPLDMPRAQWWTDAVGHTLTYCCFDAPSRDFARIGLLYARNGRWNGEQLLPERWVRDSSVSPATNPGYGYQWYPEPPALSAFGFDHQWIYVYPELDLVVVRNGHYDKDPGPPIADPNLFARYPAGGLVPGKGTVPPENSWAFGRTLGLIGDSIIGR